MNKIINKINTFFDKPKKEQKDKLESLRKTKNKVERKIEEKQKSLKKNKGNPSLLEEIETLISILKKINKKEEKLSKKIKD